VSFSTSTQSLSRETIAEMNRFRSMMIDWLSRTFSLGKDDGTIRGVANPDCEAAATLPLLEGAQLAARVAQDPQKFEAAIELLVDRLKP
jgi:TetR/AcrR family transcriptional repressor of nem operon